MHNLTTLDVATPIIPFPGASGAGPKPAMRGASFPTSSPLEVRLSIGLSRLADALSTACVAELELVGMPAFDPALAAWREEAEAGWAAAWAHAEALAVGPGGDSAARWCRRFGRAVIDVLDAEGPAVARCGFRRIAALLQDLPAALRALEGSTLARLRVCLTCLSDLCDAIDGQAEQRAAPPPG